MSANVLQPGSMDSDVEKVSTQEAKAQALRAAQAFNKMIPTLQAFVRVLTGRKDVRVIVDGRPPMTDGKNLYLRPPFALGLISRHDRKLCDQRDPDTYQQLCPACKGHESVMAAMYHEIGHIVFDSFMGTTDGDRQKAVKRIVNRFTGAKRERVETRMREAPPQQLDNYAGMAQLVNPYLPMLINVIEDARVNRSMGEARPGVRKMIKANNIDVLLRGVEQPDGSMSYWSDAPLEGQLATAFYFEMSDIEGMLDFYADEVKDLFNELPIKRLVTKASGVQTVADSYELAIEVLETCQQYGYYIDPEDQEEDDDDDGEGGDSGADPGESDDESGAESEASSPGGDGSDGDSSESGGDSDDPDGSESGAGDGADRESDPTSSGGSDGSGDVDPDAPSPTGGGTPQVHDGSGDRGDDTDGSSDRGDDDDLGEDEDSGASGDQSPEEGSEEGDESDTGDGDDDTSDSDDDVPAETQEGDGVDEDGSDGGSDHEGEDEGERSDPEAAGDPDRREGSPGDDSSEDGGDGEGSGLHQSDPQLHEPSDGGDPEGNDDDPLEQDPDAGTDQPIDTGADEGRGGVKSNRTIAPPADVQRIVEAMLGHSQGEEDHGVEDECDDQVFGECDDPTQTQDNVGDLMKVAVQKGLYFETPPQNVDGIRLHTRSQHHYSETGEDISWGFNQGHLRQYGYTMEQAGRYADLEIPETILGGALLEMRVTFDYNRQAKMLRNQKAGKIRTSVLGRRGFTDDDRLFQKKRLPGKRDYAVLIGVDISGSTLGLNISLAKRAAKAQAELLHRSGIRFAIFAHSARGDGTWTSRSLTLDIYEVKGWDDPWDDESKDMLQKLGPDNENLDGHTMEYYRKELDKQSATDKVLLYYTDGKMPAANATEELAVLQREIEECRRRNYTLLGVGIRTDSPTRHGLDTVRVDGDEDLVNVVRELRSKLLGQ